MPGIFQLLPDGKMWEQGKILEDEANRPAASGEIDPASGVQPDLAIYFDIAGCRRGQAGADGP
jgi:hypothetical protein